MQKILELAFHCGQRVSKIRAHSSSMVQKSPMNISKRKRWGSKNNIQFIKCQILLVNPCGGSNVLTNSNTVFRDCILTYSYFLYIGYFWMVFKRRKYSRTIWNVIGKGNFVGSSISIILKSMKSNHKNKQLRFLKFQKLYKIYLLPKKECSYTALVFITFFRK